MPCIQINTAIVIYIFSFVCVHALRPSQQFFSYVGTISFVLILCQAMLVLDSLYCFWWLKQTIIRNNVLAYLLV